jgi:hypothetical protein
LLDNIHFLGTAGVLIYPWMLGSLQPTDWRARVQEFSNSELSHALASHTRCPIPTLFSPSSSGSLALSLRFLESDAKPLTKPEKKKKLRKRLSVAHWPSPCAVAELGNAQRGPALERRDDRESGLLHLHAGVHEWRRKLEEK